MTPIQSAAIQALAGVSAMTIVLFDKRGKSHKPLYAVLAYLIFVQMMALVLTAHFHLDALTDWLLIFTLAIQTGSILLAGGNVSKIHTRINEPINFRLPTLKYSEKQKDNQNERQERQI